MAENKKTIDKVRNPHALQEITETSHKGEMVQDQYANNQLLSKTKMTPLLQDVAMTENVLYGLACS